MTADLTNAKIEELVWVWEEHGIWICLGCHAAVPPADGGIERHYRRKHKLKGQAIKRVLAYEEELSLTLYDPHEVKLPANGSIAIDQLPMLRGFQCPYQPCDFLTVHPNSLTTHYACPLKGHREAINTSGTARARPGEKVSLQSFSKGGRARYWIVSDIAADDNGSGEDSGYGSGFDDMLSSYGQKLASDEDKRRRTGEAPGGADVDNPWVSWTGWAEHFQEKDLAQICRMSKGPMSDAKLKRVWAATEKQRQRQLRIIADSFERVMARCTSRLRLVPRETLRWLNSIEPTTPHGKPVQLKDHESSMDDYKRYAARYLCYCFGAWQMGQEAANTELGVRFTDLQWDRLRAVVEGVFAIDLRCGGAAVRRGPASSTRQGRPGGGGIVAASRSRSEEDAGDRQEEAELEDMLDRSVMEFWIASIKQKIAFNIFQNPLLHFTAVLGIDPEKLSYKRAADYTGQLAGLVWCVRLLMLEHVFEDQSDNPEELDFAVLERFQEEHHEWLADGTYTPFSNMITYMAYGKGHREKEGGLPKVMWEDDEGALRFKGDRISVLEFRQAACRAVDDAEQLLDKLMFGHWAKTKAALDMRRIVDSLTFEGSGRSFATNHRNKWLQPGYKRVAKLGKEKLWREGKGRGKGWRQAEVVEYLALLRRFKLAMMVCCHIWLGQPGRGPEFLTMRHCDSQQLMRNSFVFDGQFMSITDRDKNRAIRGVGRKVARFLPERAGKMMVAYISWLIPFERMLHDEAGIQGPSKSLDGFLWKDAGKGRWDTELLTDRIRLLTGVEIGVALGVADYRHVAIEMGRRIQGIMIRALEIEADGNEAPDMDSLSGEVRWGRKTENVWDLQSTHGSIIAGRHYALDIRFPYQLQPKMVANFREISRLWHVFLEGGDPRVGGLLGQWNGGAKSGAKRTAVEMAVSDESYRPVKTQVVARGPMGCCTCKCECGSSSGNSVSGDKVNGSKVNGSKVNGSKDGGVGKVGVDANDGEAATGGSDITLDRCASELRRPEKEEQRGEEEVLDGDKLKCGLETLFGGQAADWKSDEQYEGMRKVMSLRGKQSLIIVLPTGGGKSIFFMLPSVVEEFGTTIVVVPFVALMDDLVDRARRDFGLDCVKWLPSTVTGRVERQPDARLVVVSADLMDSAELTAYVDSIRGRGLLRRIFFDECHTAILDSEYRDRLKKLKFLHKYGHPVVMLTATLPVRMEKWFRRLMLVEDAPIIRAKTTKSNIQYRVTTVKKGGGGGGGGAATALEESVVEEVRRLEASMTGGQKGVVFCRSTTQCERLAERLGCLYHHSGQNMTESQRKAAREQWASGRSESRWIVATTGLGTGVDVKELVAVLHMGDPYGLVEFGQQTGRGGRGWGEKVKACIFRDGQETKLDKNSSDIMRMNHEAMQSFIRLPGCRRVTMGEFMDGEGSECDEMGVERCDRCEQKALEAEVEDEMESEGAVEESRNREGRSEAVKMDRAKEFRQAEARSQLAREQWLEEVGNNCGVCYVRWCRRGRKEEARQGYRHKLEVCTYISVEEYADWRRGLEFSDFHCCWGCGLPRALCEGIGIDAESGRCRYRDQIFPVVMMAMKSGTLGRLVREEFGVDTENAKSYTEWVCRRRPICGKEVTNGFAVWDTLVQCCFRSG